MLYPLENTPFCISNQLVLFKHVPIDSIILHFRYDQSTQKNDIALAKLERSVTFRRGLRPACLPQRFRGFPLKNLKDNPKVIGWGKTENNQPISPRLLQASVPFVDNPTCSDKYGSAIAGLDISSTQICAGDDDRDSCSGGKVPAIKRYGVIQ